MLSLDPWSWLKIDLSFSNYTVMLPLLRRAVVPVVPDFLAPLTAFASLTVGPSISGVRYSHSDSGRAAQTPARSASLNGIGKDGAERTGGSLRGEKEGPPRSHNTSSSSARVRSTSAKSPISTQKTTTSPSSSRPSQPPHAANSPRRKPLRSNAGQSLSTPLDLLTQIRRSPPSSSSSPSPGLNSDRKGKNPPNPIPRNSAIINLSSGIAGSKRDFTNAFSRGWLPLRNRGEVGNLSPQDLVLVLDCCLIEERRGSKSRVVWEEMKELILWLAGEKGMPGVVDWSWKELCKGEEGAERVVEIMDAIMKGEQKLLRKGSGALNRASQDDFPVEEKQDAKPRITIESKLFGAYIVARSVQHSHATFSQRFDLLLPAFLNSSYPLLRAFLQRPGLETLLNYTFTNATAPSLSASKAQSWLRQVYLGQLFSQGPSAGIGAIRLINDNFRRGEIGIVVGIWQSIKEARDGSEVSWLESRWEATRDQHLLEGMSEEEAIEGVEKLEDLGSEDSLATTTDSESLTQTSQIPLHPPALTQALVAPFLYGFTRAQLYPEATAIWLWLSSQTPPLLPSVVLYTALLKGYAQNGNIEAAEAVLNDMKSAGVKPDEKTMSALIGAYFKAKDVGKAVEVSKTLLGDVEMRRRSKGGKFGEEVYQGLISGFLGNGNLSEAEAVLGQMEEEEVSVGLKTINLFLKYHTTGRNPNFPSIIRSLRLIAAKGLQADVYTFTMILQALLSVKESDAVQKLISIMTSSGVTPSVTTYGSLIHALASSQTRNQLTAAVELLDEMERVGLRTNEVIYTSIIQGFLNALRTNPIELSPGEVHPFLSAALAIKKRMEGRGIAMNRIGYNAIIDSSLALRTPFGSQLALKTYQELKSKYGMKHGPEASGGGRSVSSADTFFVLLNGFAQMEDWSNARGVVREMEKMGFVAKSKNLIRLVDLVRRGGWH